MKKLMRILAVLVVAAGIFMGILAVITPPPPQPPVYEKLPVTGGKSSAVYWANENKMLGDKNGEMKIYPASTTKMLTAIIALEEGKNLLDKNAVITQRAMDQDGTKVGISPDHPMSLHEMLYGMMLISGNDAAVSVAETVGGSYDRFVQMMNEKASSIGVTHSHFANPNGLTNPNHYSTAEDMVKIAGYAMKNPDFREIVKQPHYTLHYRDGTTRLIDNRNEFLESGYAGANGVKTGMTEAAGECLVASAERNGQLVIVSIYDDENRWKDVQKLLDYGFDCVAKEQKYEAELAAEPILYKWMNQLMGKEPHDKKN